MAVSSLLRIISEKWVKPTSPTPPTCRYYKLSSLDQDMVDALVSVAFFYPSPKEMMIEPSPLLETSLSKTLSYYYPFAGRLMDDNISVDCNDAGVQLWEVQIQASMSEILHQSDFRARDIVFPRGLYSYYNSVVSKSHLMIQLNYFECGGIGIGFCMSHKLGDARTLSNFVNDWAAIARGSSEPLPSPHFSGASVFPPSANPPSKPTSIMSMEKPCVTRRFVFSASRISQLKTKVAADSGVENPSKVEVVTALIFKSAAMAASRANSGGSFKPSLVTQSVNFRAITIPPLSENCVGNFVNTFMITAAEEKETTLSGLAGELRKSKLEFLDRHRKNLEGNELKLQISRDWEDVRRKSGSNSFDVYVFSSWCRFPFYEVDFGWGKPRFVSIASGLMKNMIILMDNQSGDGIEAFVTLEEDEMSIFEHDEELLTFASLNPNILGLNA